MSVRTTAKAYTMCITKFDKMNNRCIKCNKAVKVLQRYFIHDDTTIQHYDEKNCIVENKQ